MNGSSVDMSGGPVPANVGSVCPAPHYVRVTMALGSPACLGVRPNMVAAPVTGAQRPSGRTGQELRHRPHVRSLLVLPTYDSVPAGDRPTVWSASVRHDAVQGGKAA